jgi:hypothetical protein
MSLLIAIVALCACGPMAIAKTKLVAVQLPESRVTANATALAPAPGLYPVTQMFTSTPYNASLPGNGWTNNLDGSELWPCFGGELDCPTTGYPAIPFHGVTIGVPSYFHTLSACDGTTNGTQVPYTWDQGQTVFPYSINGYYVPCGQILTLYHDLTGDTTDDLLVSIVVKQGDNVIADSGIQDNGQNPFGNAGANDIIFSYQDFNFGALGVAGPNNGNCVPSFNYPVSSFPYDGFFTVAAGKTCVDPVAGPATITVRTSLSTPTYNCKDAKGCTVKYKDKYVLVQEWNIYLM